MAQTRIKHRGNKYVLQVQDADGKFKQIFSSEKKSEVNKERSKVRANSKDVKAAIDKKTFVEVYEEFYKRKIAVAEREHTSIRIKSVTHYKGWFNNYIKPLFDKSFGRKILLTEMSTKHSKDFFFVLRELDGMSWKQANKIVLSFLTVLKFAVNQQYINDFHKSFYTWKPRDDDETQSNKLEDMKVKKTKMISIPQAAKLFQYLKPKDNDVKAWQKFAVVSTLMFTGVRMSELRGLKWDAITSVETLDQQKRIVEYSEIKIFRTIVGNGSALERVKARGSLRTILVHPKLKEILDKYKSLLTKWYPNIARGYVFPSLRLTEGTTITPISDRTITDWIKLAFADLGYAKVKIHKQKDGIRRAFVQIIECEFDNNPSRTFRHFYSTALLSKQNSHSALNNKFVSGQVGHRDPKTTTMIYGDHDNLDTTDQQRLLQLAAIEDAIPIGISQK